MDIPRPEYPRPQFVRETWLNLNGSWQFSFDQPSFDLDILVPFAYQSKLSGIGIDERHDVVWYGREFDLREDWLKGRILLHFGAVDYCCRVWVNDLCVGTHVGGHVGFSFDITDAVRPGNNTVVVQAEDIYTDLTIPRGKQYWDKPQGIFYTPTTGIWQTVWIEPVNETYIRNVDITPDLDRRTVTFEYSISRPGVEFEADISFHGRPVAKERIFALRDEGKLILNLDKGIFGHDNFNSACTWSPEHPNLFDVTFRLIDDGQAVDTVESYFGLRKISIENGVILLNNYPFYQKLLLDQGYWPDSLLTAPSDEAFISDIEACRKMGFNGVRKHQKAEDPRFLYHADRLGLVVWGEMANAYEYTTDYTRRFTAEWMELIQRDYNHPCIIAWTPLNESWGVENISSDPRQAHHSCSLVELTKSLDSTRLVMSNDGWEHTIPDVLGIHDYESRPEVLSERYGSKENILSFRPAGRALFVPGYAYAGQPVMVTECGGISCDLNQGGWLDT